ncbi:MAG: TRAP transporter substrate-binding protein [Negativicutes bacterium]|nr:TRAP transporter substrate-binding protein [Negativicutes bacterium]
MRKFGLPVLLVFLVGALLSGCSSGPSQPAKTEPIKLRAAHYFKDDHPWQKGLVYFANKVKEDSKGQIDIQIFGGGVLGNESQVMQFIKDGSLDFAVSDPNAGATFAKEFDFFVLPFLFQDYDNWKKAINGPAGEKFAKVIEAKSGIKIIGYWGGSVRNLLSTNKPIQSMDELKGFRLRVSSSPAKIDVWKAVGTVPTPIAYMETYLAMKSGVVDGMENELPMVVDMKFYEPAPYITRTEHEFTVRPLFMAKQTYDKLSPELQQIVVKAAKEAADYEQKLEREASLTAEKTLQEKFKVQFFNIDKQPLKEATKPVVTGFAKTMGLEDLISDIEKAK